MDVCDEDFYGGSIIGSKNYPLQRFEELLPSVIKETSGAGIYNKLSEILVLMMNRVAFTCALIQSRSKSSSEIPSNQTKPSVYIFQGGFYEIQKEYLMFADLLQDWDQLYWSGYIESFITPLDPVVLCGSNCACIVSDR